MAKGKTIWVCSECGNESPKWMGKCPTCGAWDTFYEEKKQDTKQVNRFSENKTKDDVEVIRLKDAKTGNFTRITSGYDEVDRVLGGGFVNGSLTLIGGEPGIGKSTLILQMCENIAKEDKKVLYISGEESAEQIKLRADRLGADSENICLRFRG